MKSRRKKQRLTFPFSQRRIQKYIVSTLIALVVAAAALVLEKNEHTTATTEGSCPTLYSNQLNDDLTAIYAEAIDSAEKSVLLIVYSLTDPRIISSLKNKSTQGVPVKVICDAVSSPYIDHKLGPHVDTLRRFGPGLMHQKILVVDGQKIWLGSSNLTTESLRLYGNLVTAMHSEAMAEKIHTKASTLDAESRGPPFQHTAYTVGGQDVELWFLPDSKDASLKIKSLIRGAKKSLRIAMFAWTRQDLAKDVIAAAKRGVDTQVVIDRKLGKGAGDKVYKMLKEKGVDVALSPTGPMLHHKFMYIDGKTLVNGSANWTKRAFTENDDCFIVISNLTDVQRSKMESVWQTIWAESSNR